MYKSRTTSFTIFYKLTLRIKEYVWESYIPLLIRIPLNEKPLKPLPHRFYERVHEREFLVQTNVFERARTSKCSNVAKGTSLSRRSCKKKYNFSPNFILKNKKKKIVKYLHNNKNKKKNRMFKICCPLLSFRLPFCLF